MVNGRSKRKKMAVLEEVKRRVKRPSKASVTKQHDVAVSPRATAQRDSARGRHRVRIIGGVWKRTPLPVAEAAGLRPTPDRVRETLFNWIEHLVPDLDAVRAVDLFAGTGALGFELASRGAQRVTLVESNRQAVDHLMQTKRKLAADQVDVVPGDALTIAARWPDASFDIIFIDPPFDSTLLAPAVAAAARLITADGLIYVESGAPLDVSTLGNRGLLVVRQARAASVHFHLLRAESA